MFQRKMELLVVFTIVGSVGLLLALAEGSRYETMEEITKEERKRTCRHYLVPGQLDKILTFPRRESTPLPARRTQHIHGGVCVGGRKRQVDKPFSLLLLFILEPCIRSLSP
jgi:hypothetical protein